MKTVLFVLLSVSLAAFGLDLFHMIFHLAEEPALWQIHGVPGKFLIKLGIFLIPAMIYLCRSFWTAWLVIFMMINLSFMPELRAASQSDCESVRELLDEAGMARDAHENFMGQVKREPPYTSFPAAMDKITWWGIFKPFEFWSNPEFQAAWISPQGQEIARHKFTGTKCRLAKTSLKGEDQPRGEFQPGMWKVIITCGDYLVDQRSFAVLQTAPPVGGPKADPRAPSQQPVMIWAQDAIKEKEK